MRDWTSEEIDILKTADLKNEINNLVNTLHRSKNSIKCKARKLGLITSQYIDRHFWTDDELKLLYDAGVNLRTEANKIALKIGRSRDCVIAKGRSLDIIPTIELNNHIWTEEENQTILEHLGKISAKEIQKQYLPTLNVKALSAHIKRMGWKANNKHLNAIYSYNHSFFSNVNIRSAYWAGFIAADGCIIEAGKNKKTLAIKLSQKDHEHLEKLKQDIEYTGPTIKDYRSYQDSSNLRICLREETVEALNNNFGIVPRKTFTLLPSPIDNIELKCAFFKGFIDGDGSIQYRQCGPNWHRMRLVVVGTYEMMLWCQEICNILCDNQCTRKIYKTENIFRYETDNYKVIAPVFTKLHTLNTPELERKWSKIDMYLALCKPKWTHY